jgi:hypothetical protein
MDERRPALFIGEGEGKGEREERGGRVDSSSPSADAQAQRRKATATPAPCYFSDRGASLAATGVQFYRRCLPLFPFVSALGHLAEPRPSGSRARAKGT